MAQLLIITKQHWTELTPMDDLDTRRKRAGRPRVGDVILVRPDDWEWGRLEGPPDFLVVRLPGVPCGALKHLEEPGDNGQRRRYNAHKIVVAAMNASTIDGSFSCDVKYLVENLRDKRAKPMTD